MEHEPVVHVGPVDYELRVREDLQDTEKALGTNDQHPAPVIQVQAGLSPQATGQVLLHEILHCLSEQRGLGLSEAKVLSLEDGITSALRDNRWLVDLLLSQDQSPPELSPDRFTDPFTNGTPVSRATS